MSKYGEHTLAEPKLKITPQCTPTPPNRVRNKQQSISARERALCQLTVCFEFQSRSDRRKGHKVVPWKWCPEGK